MLMHILLTSEYMESSNLIYIYQKTIYILYIENIR